LIGCIGATIIIILASFTTVIGVQNTKTITNKHNSPLFNMRAQRAISNTNGNTIDADYIKKGKTTIPLPTYNKMDDIKKILKNYNIDLNNVFV